MIIITVLTLMVPALIGVLCYERFKGVVLTLQKRIELYFVFAFLVNLGAYVLFFMRGYDRIYWILGNESSATWTVFIIQYMIFTAVAAIVLAFILSLVRISKTKK